MPLYCGNKKYGIVKSVSSSKLEEKTIDKNGIYTPSTGYDGFSNINADVSNYWINPSPYLDDKGNFVKPDEWDDIESIELSDTDQEVYYLFDNTRVLSWCSIKITTSSGNSFCDYGRVKNGIFETLLTETKTSGSSYYQVFTDTFPDEDYIVLRFRPTEGENLTRVELGGNNIYKGRALLVTQQPLLMRYGSMPYAQIITCNTLNLISDNLMNCGALTTLANLYNNCQWLVRHRHKNWNTSNVTTISSMFASCWCLIDCDTDFSDWLSEGKCTAINAFMSGCYSIRGEINVTGWQTQNVTNISTMFYNCYNLTKIKGIESWYLPIVVVASNNYPFNNCYSLYQNENKKLDLTNWKLSENVTSAQNYISFFANCRNLKEIDISTWNMNYVSNISSMFTTCYALEKVLLPDNIGSGGLLETTSSMFINDYSLKSIDLSKINFSQVATMGTMCNMCLNLEEIIPPTTTPAGANSANALVAICQYSQLETIDLSWLDLSKFTHANSQYSDMFKQQLKLKNLIPPINIGKNFSVSTCPNLSRDSLLAIINNLLTVTTKTTLSLSAANLAKLTDDEIAVATGKGWTVT